MLEVSHAPRRANGSSPAVGLPQFAQVSVWSSLVDALGEVTRRTPGGTPASSAQSGVPRTTEEPRRGDSRIALWWGRMTPQAFCENLLHLQLLLCRPQPG